LVPNQTICFPHNEFKGGNTDEGEKTSVKTTELQLLLTIYINDHIVMTSTTRNHHKCHHEQDTNDMQELMEHHQQSQHVATPPRG
jgi:hypothetical protein